MWSVQGVDGVPVLVEVERPPVGAGEILLEVVAAGVNRADLLQVAGHYPPPAGAPQTLGLEAAGTVVEVGPGVDPVWLGRAAVALVEGGAQAQFCVALRIWLCLYLFPGDSTAMLRGLPCWKRR